MQDRVSLEFSNGIADVRLDRTDKLNALDRPMFEAIIATGEQLAALHGLRVVVLSGEGRCFSAGIDLTGFDAIRESGPLARRTHGDCNIFQKAAMQWRDLPVPVIAAIHGVCFGGGLQIASGADIRIAAPDARFSVMEMKWGLIPDMAGHPLWRGNVRDDILRELTYTAREFNGVEAREIGMVTMLDDAPHARAMQLAADIAGKSPSAMRAAKALFERAPNMDRSALLLAESEVEDTLIFKPDQLEAVAAGMEKRAAVYRD